jgi:hypothetical protein
LGAHILNLKALLTFQRILLLQPLKDILLHGQEAIIPDMQEAEINLI